MKLTFRVYNANTRAPIQGAVITFISPVQHTRTTDLTGTAIFELLGSGFFRYRITAKDHTAYEAAIEIVQGRDIVQDRYLESEMPAPSVPNTTQREYGARVGTSCQLLVDYTFGRRWHGYRHDRLGDIVTGKDESVRSQAEQDPRCFETAPPPAPTPAELGQKVDALGSVVNTILRKVDILTSAIDALKAWIIDNILDLIWSALTRERKAN